MQILAIVLLIIQLLLIVHVFKTNRSIHWAALIMFVPAIGALAYFIMVLLPEWKEGNVADESKKQISNHTDS